MILIAMATIFVAICFVWWFFWAMNRVISKDFYDE